MCLSLTHLSHVHREQPLLETVTTPSYFVRTDFKRVSEWVSKSASLYVCIFFQWHSAMATQKHLNTQPCRHTLQGPHMIVTMLCWMIMIILLWWKQSGDIYVVLTLTLSSYVTNIRPTFVHFLSHIINIHLITTFFKIYSFTVIPVLTSSVHSYTSDCWTAVSTCNGRSHPRSFTKAEYPEHLQKRTCIISLSL